MRINKLLSNAGICSRREANRIILDKRILVNGELCREGQWVEETDLILLDNEKIKPKPKVYLAFNKPVGVTCTLAKEVKNNIIDFINYKDYIFPVGRLDKESEGLILMTNDGELADYILNSDNEKEKEYIVRLDREFDIDFIKNMKNGVPILNKVTRECKVFKISSDTFRIILTQGLNKQIRRMCKHFGYNVISLKRIRIRNIELGELEEGKWRHLTEDELKKLKK